MCNLTGGTVRCKVDFQAGERVRAKPALMITSDDRSAEKTVTDASPTKDLINGFSHCRYKTFQKFLRYFPRSDRRPKTKQSAATRLTTEKTDRRKEKCRNVDAVIGYRYSIGKTTRSSFKKSLSSYRQRMTPRPRCLSISLSNTSKASAMLFVGLALFLISIG